MATVAPPAPTAAADATATAAAPEPPAAAANADKPCVLTASVTFPSPAAATVAAAALAVDPELRPTLVSKAVWADGDRVRFRFAAADARLLRAAACTFCDLGGVAARAVEAFPPVDEA